MNYKIDVFCSHATDSKKKKCLELIANVFRRSKQKPRLFSIFSSFIFCSNIYLFDKRELNGAHSSLPSTDSLNYSSSLFKG